MARGRRKKKPKAAPPFSSMIPVLPVTDQGITLEVMGTWSYLYASSSNNPWTPYIAEVTGLDPTYRYARKFIGKSTAFGHTCCQFKVLSKPMLLDIRAHERDYYLLRPDGAANVKLERIERPTLDRLI